MSCFTPFPFHHGHYRQNGPSKDSSRKLISSLKNGLGLYLTESVKLFVFCFWLLFFFFLIYFIYLFLAALGLRCCTQAFSSCVEWGLPFIVVHRLPHCGGFSCCGAWALGTRASVVVSHRLQSTGSVVVAHGPSRSAACGILPDQGSNLCPLHRQADSQPLRHQGSPAFGFLYCSWKITTTTKINCTKIKILFCESWETWSKC